MKRSTSTSAVTQPQHEKKSKPTLSDTIKMKHSKSCPKISNSASNVKSKSPNRKIVSQTSNKIGSNLKRPSKTLKLNLVKKQIFKDDIEAINPDSIESLPNLKEQHRIELDRESVRPRTYNKNDFEVEKSLTNGNNNLSEEQVATHRILNTMTAIGAYDSVELSFMEKLDKANMRHSRELEDLATFEMLEDKLATNDSSICSSISALRKSSKSKQEAQKEENVSPSISPVLSRHPFADAASATSTPLSIKPTTEKNKNIKKNNIRDSEAYRRKIEGSIILEERDLKNDVPNALDLQRNSHIFSKELLEDPVVNHNLMLDIQKFLKSNNGIQEDENIKMVEKNNDDHDTEEDDTLKDEAIDGIPSDDDEFTNKLYRGHLSNGLPVSTTNSYGICDGQFSDNSIEDENGYNKSKAKNVRFQEKKKQEALTFSPPRIPKNSPSYLIWSIFTKEREERNRQKATKLREEIDEDEEWLDVEDHEAPDNRETRYHSQDKHFDRDKPSEDPKNIITKSKKHDVRRRRRSESPLSRIISSNKMSEVNNDMFCDTLLNAKLVELNKQVEEFKKENTNLQNYRRRLNTDKKQLAKDIEEFEKNKEIDKKKLDEERKRVRREKAMFEKSLKDKKANNDKKSQDDLEELQMKLQKLNEELNRKESKWALALSKLQEQVKFLERENQQLHEENHKLKLKGVSAKVSSHLIDPATRRIYSASNSVQGINSPMSSSKASSTSNQLFYNSGKAILEVSKSHSVESGMRPESISSASPLHSNNIDMDPTAHNPNENNSHRDNLDARRLMSFSPAESLESDVTLVSAGISDQSSKITSNIIATKGVEKTVSQNDDQKKEQSERLAVGSIVKKVDKVEKSNEKVVKYYTDGSIEICCANGHRKEISPDGKNTKVFYNNGDIKETLPNGLVKYFYSGVKTWHFKYEDGREVTQFHNGKSETKFPDGTIVIEEVNGDSIILLPNGQKEEHTSQYKVKYDAE